MGHRCSGNRLAPEPSFTVTTTWPSTFLMAAVVLHLPETRTQRWYTSDTSVPMAEKLSNSIMVKVVDTELPCQAIMPKPGLAAILNTPMLAVLLISVLPFRGQNTKTAPPVFPSCMFSLFSAARQPAGPAPLFALVPGPRSSVLRRWSNFGTPSGASIQWFLGS